MFIFKLRYYERFNFVGNPQPYEPSTTNPENYYLTNDFIDIFIKLKLSSVCSSMPETHKLESWAYQIYVIAYIILKIFFPAIHKSPDSARSIPALQIWYDWHTS